MRFLVLILLLLISLFNGVAQNYADKEYYLVDSLDLDALSESDRELIEASLNKYHSAKDDTRKINALTNICENLNHESWIEYQWYQYNLINKCLKKNDSEELKKSLALALNNLGFAADLKGDKDQALKHYLNSLKLQKYVWDSSNTATILTNIGVLYYTKGDIKRALKYYQSALTIRENLNDKFGIANSLVKFGNIYQLQQDSEKALKAYENSFKLFKEIGEQSGQAECLNNIGILYREKGQLDTALAYYKKALNILRNIKGQQGIAYCLNNIGVIYYNQENYELALENHEEAYRIRNEINDKFGEAQSLGHIASSKFKLGRIDGEFGALYIALKGHELALKMNHPRNISATSQTLSEIYTDRKDYKKALKFYKLHIQMRDSINNEETQKATIRQQTQYEFEKEQIRKENEAKEIARIEAEELKRRNNMEYSLIFLGILVLFGLVLMLGFIKVSPNIAEGLIFFTFLIFFEFLLVFAEPYLEQYTQGEPVYALLANSALALVIFPLHAVLERLLKKRIVRIN